MTELPSEMFDYYAGFAEADRLTGPAGELEAARTRELLGRFLPPAPADILDVGGATGVHALWLAGSGHRVELVDPVPHHVDQALRASESAGGLLVGCAIGDARELRHDDASVDAVLLLGPLYHLVEQDDRRRALAEARRVLRPGGVLVAAAVSRFASLLGCLADGLLDDPDFVAVVRQDLHDGQHRNPPGKPWFTTTFFHRPADLAAEVADAGFPRPRLIAVEGPLMWTGGFADDWADTGRRALMLDLLRAVEEEPTMVGGGAHFLAIARA